MRTTITDRCTALIGRARAVLRRHSLRKPDLHGLMGMELLDMELFRNDIRG
ncbi:hypothetical protein [Azospirillum doebereinerae]